MTPPALQPHRRPRGPTQRGGYTRTVKLPPDFGLPTDAWYRLPLAAALERIAARAELAHVHLHDNRGPADAGAPHLPLGRGIVDAGAVVRKARESGARVILELLDEAAIAESVAYLERRGILRTS